MTLQAQQGNWRYPVTDVTLDKHGPRTAVSGRLSAAAAYASADPTTAANAAELVGWDMSMVGGLRPHPGFIVCGEMLKSGVASPIDATAKAARKGDFFPVALRSGDSDFVYGVIWRNGAGDIIWNEMTQGMAGSTTTTVIAAATDVTKAMGVAVKGRFLYVFVKGSAPILCYQPPSSAFQVRTDTGPGSMGGLVPPDQSVGVENYETANSGQVTLGGQAPSNYGFSAVQPDSSVRQLDPGDYVFAYQLYDSVTGRRGPLSRVAPVQQGLFGTTGAGGGWPAGSGSGGGGTGTGQSGPGDTSAGAFAVLELVEPTAAPVKWTHAYVYRSVRMQTSGGTFAAGVLFQEAFILLSTYQAPNQSGVPANYKRYLYWYSLQDKELLYQPTYGDYFSFDAAMPLAGCGAFYNNMLVLGNTSNAGSTFPYTSTGEIRWSSAQELNPELFSALSRYVPNQPNDQVLRFVPLGGNLIGFSANKMYLVRESGGFVQVIEMHDGYGIPNPRAVTVVGNTAYFVTSKGLKSLDAQGQIDDVQAVNKILLQEWAGTYVNAGLSNVQLAYDATLSVLFILNPDIGSGRLVLLWLNTGRVSELYDASFVSVAEGLSSCVAANTEGALGTGTPLERALFLDGFNRIYVVDVTRSKSTLLGSAAVRMLSPTRFPANNPVVSMVGTVTGVTLDATGRYVPLLGDGYSTTRIQMTGAWGSTPSWLEGCWIYVVKAATANAATTQVGFATQIVKVNGAGDAQCYPLVPSGYIGVGDTVGVSPIYCRWVGHQLGLMDESGQTYRSSDFFRVRSVGALGLSMVDVAGGTGSVYESFRALVYKANQALPYVKGFAVGPDGTQVQTLVEGEGTNYASFATGTSLVARAAPRGTSLFPGFETFVPDVDFRVLEVSVRGDILATERTSRASV